VTDTVTVAAIFFITWSFYITRYLKKGREAQNISLSDISDLTKISKMYLDSLEKDEYTKIPGEPYVKGYISSYAECVGINAHEALKMYDSVNMETNNTEELKSEILDDKKRLTLPYLSFRKITWLVLAFSILTVLAIGAYYGFFQNQKESTVDKSPREPNEIIQPNIISKTDTNILQERQNGDSFQSGKQDGFEKKLENMVSREKHEIGISKIPAPLEIHQPEPITQEGEPYVPIHESSRDIDLSDSENYQAHFENNLKVIEATACSEIINRTPQRPADSFEWSTDRIYIWSRIKCESPPSSIRHIYHFKGEKINDVLLKVRSSNWRTWSYKTLLNKRYIGPWRVDITSADGRLLRSIKFEIR
jgi:cytoskeletal protein RodZ